MWNLVFAVGRVALVALFIKSGAEKLIDPSGLTGMLAAKAFPMPKLFAYAAGIAEVGLGILVAVGWQARIAAFGLIAFTIVATLLGARLLGHDRPGAAHERAAFWKTSPSSAA